MSPTFTFASESFASWLSAFKLSSLSLVFTFALPVLASAAVTSPLARSTFAAADFVDLVVSADLVADDVDDFDGAVPLDVPCAATAPANARVTNGTSRILSMLFISSPPSATLDAGVGNPFKTLKEVKRNALYVKLLAPRAASRTI